jgi:hypothetical protein
MSHTITFEDYRAYVVYSSMAEGMWEVARDNNEHGHQALLDALMKWAGELCSPQGGPNPPYPFNITTSDDYLVDIAQSVLENCIDNSSGMKPEDEDAPDYLFAGQVAITSEGRPQTRLMINEIEANVMARLTFNGTMDDYPEFTAEVATALLEKVRASMAVFPKQ